MKLKVEYSISPGTHTPVCEDTALIGDKIFCEGNGSLEIETPCRIALLDGVGGNGGGHEASVFVAERLKELTAAGEAQAYYDGLKQINMELIGQGGANSKRATTLAALCFEDSGMYMAYAGNTRIYEGKNGCLRQITEDHTTYALLRAAGDLEAAEKCNKNEIRTAFGGGNPAYLRGLCVEPVFERRIPKSILLTTDGVHDTLTQDELEAETSPDGLTRLARKNGSTDDCSAIKIYIMP